MRLPTGNLHCLFSECALNLLTLTLRKALDFAAYGGEPRAIRSAMWRVPQV